MAKETDVGESSQTNVDLNAAESDTELQSIFKKLRVNTKPKKVPSLERRNRITRLKTRNPGHVEKHSRKKLIQEARFVHTSTHEDIKNKTTTSSRSEGKTISKALLEGLQASEVKPTTPPFKKSCVQFRVPGCGEQFRNGRNIKVSKSLNMDDTTPGELAAYFDQLLHIPKPMSQMAEMMYT